MNVNGCDRVRDALPSLVRGELLPPDKTAAELHLAGCPECRAEADVVRLLQDALAPVPAGLEARVVGAVRRHGRGEHSWMRHPARLAMAATVAAAVIGGSFVFERAGYLERAGFRAPGEASVTDLDAYAVSWSAAEDPLLHGASTLQQLSVEELEVLLAELDR